jgi:hypothetical protein
VLTQVMCMYTTSKRLNAIVLDAMKAVKLVAGAKALKTAKSSRKPTVALNVLKVGVSGPIRVIVAIHFALAVVPVLCLANALPVETSTMKVLAPKSVLRCKYITQQIILGNRILMGNMPMEQHV